MTEIMMIEKPAVKCIMVHSGVSEDFMYEWEALVFEYEDDTSEVISRISTTSDSPEDNSLSRMGSHDIEKVVQAVEINPQCLFGKQYHENSYGEEF